MLCRKAFIIDISHLTSQTVFLLALTPSLRSSYTIKPYNRTILSYCQELSGTPLWAGKIVWGAVLIGANWLVALASLRSRLVYGRGLLGVINGVVGYSYLEVIGGQCPPYTAHS